MPTFRGLQLEPTDQPPPGCAIWTDGHGLYFRRANGQVVDISAGRRIADARATRALRDRRRRERGHG